MSHTIEFKANISEDRRVEVVLPPEVPVGEAEFVLFVKPRQRRSTGADLADSELFGMWADRTDLGDSAMYARELRRRAWSRSSDGTVDTC
jgi:hypothetical protein